jgi:hypothetical protein
MRQNQMALAGRIFFTGNIQRFYFDRINIRFQGDNLFSMLTEFNAFTAGHKKGSCYIYSKPDQPARLVTNPFMTSKNYSLTIRKLNKVNFRYSVKAFVPFSTFQTVSLHFHHHATIPIRSIDSSSSSLSRYREHKKCRRIKPIRL